MIEWFLLMIYFGIDSDWIKYVDYGILVFIVCMMKGNFQLRIVVIGFVDVFVLEFYNDELFYFCVKVVVDYMVVNYGIGCGCFVIQWKGEFELFVLSGNSYMNCCVEFWVV